MRVLLGVLAVTLLAGGVAAPAGAAVTPALRVDDVAGGARAVVTLSSATPFSRRTRPRGVSMRLGTRTVPFARRSATARKITFATPVQRGAAATKLRALRGKAVSLRVRTLAGTRTLRPRAAAPPAPPAPTPAPQPAPAPGAAPPTGTTPATPPPSGPSLTRDDAAGRAAMAGDLLLERAEFGGSGRTATYTRLWFLADGRFRLNVVDWNDVSGERCARSHTGTWTFKEGYTTEERGGGTIVKVGIAAGAIAGDEVLAFPRSGSSVFVGPDGKEFTRNPDMAQTC